MPTRQDESTYSPAAARQPQADPAALPPRRRWEERVAHSVAAHEDNRSEAPKPNSEAPKPNNDGIAGQLWGRPARTLCL